MSKSQALWWAIASFVVLCVSLLANQAFCIGVFGFTTLGLTFYWCLLTDRDVRLLQETRAEAWRAEQAKPLPPITSAESFDLLPPSRLD